MRRRERRKRSHTRLAGALGGQVARPGGGGCDRGSPVSDAGDRSPVRARAAGCPRRDRRGVAGRAEYYLRVAEEAAQDFSGRKQSAVLARLEIEHDNFRAALQWSVADSQTDLCLRLAAALWQFWLFHGHINEGREWLAQVLEPRQLATSRAIAVRVRAEALSGAGFLAMRQADFSAARSLFEQSLDLSRELGDLSGIAFCLNDLGVLADDEGAYPFAISAHKQSLAMRREISDRLRVAASLGNLGSAVMHRAMIEALNGRATPEKHAPEYARARALLEEALGVRREREEVQWIAGTLIDLGFLADIQGEYPSARSSHAEALAISLELGDRECIGCALVGLSALAATEGKPQRAMRLAGAASSVRELLGTQLPLAERKLLDHRLRRFWLSGGPEREERYGQIADQLACGSSRRSTCEKSELANSHAAASSAVPITRMTGRTCPKTSSINTGVSAIGPIIGASLRTCSTQSVTGGFSREAVVTTATPPTVPDRGGSRSAGRAHLNELQRAPGLE